MQEFIIRTFIVRAFSVITAENNNYSCYSVIPVLARQQPGARHSINQIVVSGKPQSPIQLAVFC